MVTQSHDPHAALGSERSPVWPGPSASGGWSYTPFLSIYPRSRKSREAQGGLEHGFLPAGALDRQLLSTPVCQSLRPETGAGLCMVGSAHPPFHAWGQIPLLVRPRAERELGASPLMRFCFQDCFDMMNGRRKTWL